MHACTSILCNKQILLTQGFNMYSVKYTKMYYHNPDDNSLKTYRHKPQLVYMTV